MNKNKHFKRIPDYINRELNGIKSPYVVVSATLKVSLAEIAEGKYRHLGISLKEGNLTMSPTILPPASNGTYSKRNRDGYEIIFKKLPKVSKTFYWETPNFGDPSKGTHENSWTRKVFQRQFVAPREWNLSLEILQQKGDVVLLKVTIDTLFDRNHIAFADDLLFALNLLQENVRDSHVFDANASLDEYLKVTSLGWEIFPKGTLEHAVEKVLGQIRAMTPEKEKRIEDRAHFISTLNPLEYFVGIGMNSKYFGAKFADNLVAFENVDYGNAVYILFGNWEELSKKSPSEILKRPDKDFVRIPHTRYWKKNLHNEIKRHLNH